MSLMSKIEHGEAAGKGTDKASRSCKQVATTQKSSPTENSRDDSDSVQFIDNVVTIFAEWFIGSSRVDCCARPLMCR